MVGAAMNARARVEAAGIVPTVLCIHSFSSSALQYQGLAQRLGPLTDPDTLAANKRPIAALEKG
jgi:hypothetical protein